MVTEVDAEFRFRSIVTFSDDDVEPTKQDLAEALTDYVWDFVQDGNRLDPESVTVHDVWRG